MTVTEENSPENIRQLLNTLNRFYIEPVSMFFRKPTLDDVFMEITNDDNKGVAISE